MQSAAPCVRSHGRQRFCPRNKRASRPPNLDTVWEAMWEASSAPTFKEAMRDDVPGSPTDERMQGVLLVRPPAWGPLRAVWRCPFISRYALLLPGSPSRLLWFQEESATMDTFDSELILLSPIQLHCLPPKEGVSVFRFTLSVAGGAPLELGAMTDELRQRWIWELGESVCHQPSLLARTLDGSNTSLHSLGGSANSLHALDSDVGPIRVKLARVADMYWMGKVLEAGDDFAVVEGVHLRTRSSRALKLVNKAGRTSAAGELRHGGGLQRGELPRAGSTCLQGGSTSLQKLAQCIGEVYEGPKHVCIVMLWGTHELDSCHLISTLVLETLRVLHELFVLPRSGLMIQGDDVCKLITRQLALDWHLQSNLFP